MIYFTIINLISNILLNTAQTNYEKGYMIGNLLISCGMFALALNQIGRIVE